MRRLFTKFYGSSKAFGRPERRVEPRREMTVVCAASFRLKDGEKRALLLDLSHSGARFGTAVDARSITLNEGDVIEFYVSTPYGSITRRGEVVWARPDDNVFTWGVRFVSVHEVDEEPVQRLLAA